MAGFEESLGVVGRELAPLALGPLGRVVAQAPRAAAGVAAVFGLPSQAGGQEAARLRIDQRLADKVNTELRRRAAGQSRDARGRFKGDMDE